MDEQAPLAMAYDVGSVSPAEVARGLADLAPVVFLLPGSPRVRTLRPVLSQPGRVTQLTGDAERGTVLVRRPAPAGLLTFSENLLRTTADLAHALGLPFHTPGLAAVLTDKYRQRERLRTAGVDAVRCHAVPDAMAWEPALAAVSPTRRTETTAGAGQPGRLRHTERRRGGRPAPTALRHRRTRWGPADSGLPTGPWVLEELLEGRPSLPFGDYSPWKPPRDRTTRPSSR